MKRQIRLDVFVLFLVLGFLSACSSSGKIVIAQPPNEPIVHSKTVALSVEPDVAQEDLEPIHTDVANRIRAALFGRLVSDRIFKAVVHSSDPADYGMEVKVTGAREVSTGARIWLGAMAGSNNLKLDVSLQNRATKSVVTEFYVEGASASHPFSSQAGLDDAIREAVQRVIDALR